jgi:hypothetical protein
VTSSTRLRVAFVAGVLVVGALPVLGAWLRSSGDRCAWDGVRIDDRYRTRLETAEGRNEELCCVSCLVRRLAQGTTSTRARAFVTDESNGNLVAADSAWFVRSAVVTDPVTGNRVHAFATEHAARRHASSFHGTVLGQGLPNQDDLDAGPP